MCSDSVSEGFTKERDRLHLQMMSAVSHDLKTPLASIIGSLEIYNKMQDILSAEKKTALIQTAIQEAYRLDGFISNILDIARLENGMVNASVQSYDVKYIVDETVQKLGNRINKNSVHCKFPDSALSCVTDASLASRAMQCVLDNAIKFGGDPDPQIYIDCETQGDFVHINIHDNGHGISAEDHDKIFNKYTRLTKRDYKNAGTGLGLTLSRMIMRLLGGDVMIQKEKGVYSGAWFVLKIPCQK